MKKGVAFLIIVVSLILLASVVFYFYSTEILFGPPHSPIISSINPPSFPSALNVEVTLSGQFFESGSQLLILDEGGNPIIIDQARLTITLSAITFDYIANELPIGTYQVSVRNPSSGLTSNMVNLIITSNPTITSLNPQIVLNDVPNVITINGHDFDPFAVVVDDTVLESSSGLWQYVDSDLMTLTIPVIPSPLPPGDYSIKVKNLDGAVSESMTLRVNYPFTYFISLAPRTITATPGSTFNVDVTLNSVTFTSHEEVALTVQPPTGVTSSFADRNTCVPNIPSTVVEGISYCTLPITIGVGNIVAAQTYIIPITATSVLTSVTKNVDFTLIGESGNAPDDDHDGVPNSIDLCPNTPAGILVSSLNGCPLPLATKFSPSLTTDFAQVIDLRQIVNLKLGIVGLGMIQFLDNEISVLRQVDGLVYQALDLDAGVIIESNKIGINAELYPELNFPVTLTFSGLNYTAWPVPLKNGVICPATECVSLGYSNGSYSVKVPGFSNYTTQEGTCGNSYCSPDESCSICASDCGSCPSSSSSSSGGGSSSGRGSSSGGTVTYQCNDGRDNDNDGLIDYPGDLGCSSATDNNELDEGQLKGNLTDLDRDKDSVEENKVISEKSSGLRIVFWIVLILLIAGIVVALVIMLRYARNNKKFSELAQMDITKPSPAELSGSVNSVLNFNTSL